MRNKAFGTQTCQFKSPERTQLKIDNFITVNWHREEIFHSWK